MGVSILTPIVLGWLAAWLVNYLSDVLPFTRKLSHPTCPHCNAKAGWQDYLLFKKCQVCGRQWRLRAIVVQFITLAISVYLWLYPPAKLGFGLAFIILIYMLVVMVIDLEHRIVMHPVTLAGAVLGLAIGTVLHGLLNTIAGGVAGLGFMYILYAFGQLFSKQIAKRRGEPIEDALGFGDVTLSGVLGLILGWPWIAAGLLGSILFGGLITLFIVIGMLVTKRYQAFTAIPYAPFLIIGTLYILFR
jgi:leader peptidase (prepilin peptidase)/N-methyltransferase